MRAGLPEDPLQQRAWPTPVGDAWSGARLRAHESRRHRSTARLVGASVDVGEPEVPRVIVALLAVILATTLWSFQQYGSSPSSADLARAGGAGVGAVATGAWWKLLVANLLHANILHLVMNVFVIYLAGRWLEHVAGRLLTLATIAWSAVFASIGALLIDAAAVTIGASGIAFGIVGCLVAIDPRGRSAAGVIGRQLAIVNVIATFLIPGISIGGHLGGLAAGVLVGACCWRRVETPEHPVGTLRAPVVIVALVLVAAPVLLLAAGPATAPGDSASSRSRIVAPLLERQLAGARLDSGARVDRASCSATDEPTVYRCRIELDGDPARAVVTFEAPTDQWTLTATPG